MQNLNITSCFTKGTLEQKQITLLKLNKNTYYISINKFVIICYELFMFSPRKKEIETKDGDKKNK